MKKIVNCRSCRARIFFIRTPRGKSHPVDADPVRIWKQGPADLVGDPGDWTQVEGHTSHFATCPDADRFRKPRETADDRGNR